MLREAYSLIFFHGELMLARSKRLHLLFRFAKDLIFGGSRYVQAYQIKGLVGSVNSPVETLFIGSRESAYEFAGETYSHFESLSHLRELRQGQIDPLQLPQTEIVAACIDKPFIRKFQKQNYLVLPSVSFGLDLRMSTAALIRRMSRRRRRDLRKIRGFNYSYSISRNDDRDFDFFYREMYVPYTRKRFGRTAHVKEYAASKAIYNANGGILFLKKKEITVAGILFQIKGKELCASSFGVYNGDESLVQSMTSQAALFFLIEWGKVRRMESLDYGLSSPFFKGGVFTYKKEWGMSASEQRESAFCVLRINSVNESSLEFLQQNPFIAADRGELKGIVFIDHKVTKAELQQIHSRYYLPNLHSLIVASYYKTCPVTRDAVESCAGKPADDLMSPLRSICQTLRETGFSVEIFEI